MMGAEIVDYLGIRDLFVDDAHMRAFYNCMELSCATVHDLERQSLFFILTHNEFYRENIKRIYNFNENCIYLEKYENENTYSSGENTVIQLAYNLFNGYGDCDVCSMFKSIDILSFEVCINAIRIRFKRLDVDYVKYSKYQEKINKIMSDRKAISEGY